MNCRFYDEGGLSTIKFLPTPALEVNIPIQQFKNHKFEFLIGPATFEYGHFNFTTSKDEIKSDRFCSIVQDTFYFGTESYNLSTYSFLRVEMTLKYSNNYYKITLEDENTTKITDFNYYDGYFKTSDNFTFYSSYLDSNLTLYHFGGDIEYSSRWRTLQDYCNDDEQYPTGELLSKEYDKVLWALPAPDEFIYDYTYSIYVSEFQFVRTEFTNYINYDDFTTAGDYIYEWQNLTATFYYPNGDYKYNVSFAVYTVDDDSLSRRYLYVEVFNGSELLFEESGYETLTPNSDYTTSTGKFAVWRTEDNMIGIKFADSGTLLTDSTSLEDYEYYFIRDNIQNLQCNITVKYSMDAYDGNQYAELLGYQIFDSFELGYGYLSGVSEPHFSTTWWESIPILREIIYAFAFVGQVILAGIGVIVSGAVILFTPLFNGIVTVVGTVASAVWAFFEASINTIISGINGVGALVWGFFESAINSITSTVADILAGIIGFIEDALSNVLIFILEGGLQTLFEGLITIFTSILETVMNTVGAIFGITGLGTSIIDFIEMFADIVVGTISFLTNMISIGVNLILFVNTYIVMFSDEAFALIAIYACYDIATAFIDNDMDRLGKYVNALIFIGELFYTIANSVIQFIGGIIP